MRPLRQEIATLSGFELRISPFVNLVRSPGQTVFGLLMLVTHDDLHQTYRRLRTVYFPEAVIALDVEGRARPALCYVVPSMPPGQAEADHVEALASAGEALGFPAWYLQKIRSFLPHEAATPGKQP
jgi:hypothetical protein